MENSAAMKIFVGSSIRGEARAERDKTDDYFYKLGDELRLRGAQLRLFGCITWDTRMRVEGSQKALNAMIEGSDAAVFMLAGDVGEYTREEIDIALDAAKKSGKPKVYIFAKEVKSTSEGQKKVKQVKVDCVGVAEFFEYAEFDEIKGRLRDVVRKDGGQASLALQALAGAGKSAQGGYKEFVAGDRHEEVNTSSIYVFISSALNKAARTKLCNEISGMGLIFEDVFKVRIEPVTCDYGSLDAQKAIDEAVGKGDICCFVFDGEYKKEDSAEFDKACELMKGSLDKRGDGAGNIKPRIYCFFTKDRCDKATEEMRERIAGEYKHYYEEYSELAAVQYRVIMSVIDLIGATCGMSENGLIYAGDKVLFAAGFLPEFFNNKKLEDAEKEFFEARRKYEELKFLHENLPTPETEREFAKAAESYKRLKDEVEYLRASIMNASLRLVHTADGEILREEAEAREKFLRGDLDGANNAISVSQIMQCAHAEYEENKRRNLAYIHALLFKAEVIESCTYDSEEEQGKARRECYLAIKEIAERGNVGCDGILAYLKYLLKYEENADSVLRECSDQVEIFDGKRSYLDITDEYRADIHIVLGEAYLKKGDFSKAQEEIKKAIEAYERLVKDMPTINNKIAEAYLLLARIAEECEDHANAAKYYFNAGRSYQKQNNFKPCEESYKQAYEIYERQAETNSAAYEPDLATSCNNLGNLYIDVKKYAEAEEYHKRAYEIRMILVEKKAAAYEPDLAASCNNLGNLYSEMKRYAEAEEYHKRAYEICERLAEKNVAAYEPDLAASCNNLGTLYSDLNRYNEAEEYYQQAYEIRKRLAENDPAAYEPNLAMSCNNLGNLYIDVKKYAEAEEYHKRAYEIYERLAEKNVAAYEPDLAASCNNLGTLYSDLNRYNEAEEYYKRAYEIRMILVEKNAAAYEPDLANSCNNLGVLYYEQNRYTEAEEYYKRAYEIRKKLAENDPEAYEPDLAMSCNNLGVLYRKLSRYKEAEEYYKRAYEIFNELAEKNSAAYEPYLAMSCNNLGSLYCRQNRYTEAEEYHKRAYEIRTRLAEKNPAAYEPDLADSCNNLGNLYSDVKRYAEAGEHYKRAYEIFNELAEKNSAAYAPYLATSCNNLGVLYSDLKRYAEAEKYYKQAYNIYDKLIKINFAAYAPDFAKSCNNLGSLYNDLDREEEAEKYLKQACDIYKPLAESCPEIYEEKLATTLAWLAYATALSEKMEEAKGYCCEALEVINKIRQRGGSAEELEQGVKGLLEILNEEE